MSSRLTFLARPQSPVLATGYDGNPLCSSSRPKNTVYGVGCLTRLGVMELERLTVRGFYVPVHDLIIPASVLSSILHCYSYLDKVIECVPKKWLR